MNIELVTVFYILLLLCASALCIALVVYLNRITRSIREMQTDIKDLSIQIKPLIASSTNLTEKLNTVTDQAKGQLQVTQSIISDFRNRADKILELEEKVRTNIEGPVNFVIKNLSAVVNGINTFKNTYKSNGR